ncbi:lactate dehydrogenase [Rhizobium sp. Root1203]|uniref:D-lactate dehydrogenase n=1 Tax=Rhizobium sp. Root1203 TaxID=1736427 RepID=UPI00070D3356|nr:D-lactate dehydrogenase [Rhizobium sp. Root1203]KQV17302.1 lactate dehydrogenase [Rhizobium sp. Root1203]
MAQKQSADSAQCFLASIVKAVGAAHVLLEPKAMRRYVYGYRFGSGAALAVVRPGTLLQLWHVLQACIAAGKIVVAQASNTGLTGGSTPFGDDYDRDVVIINMMRVKNLYLIKDGTQVVCFPGTTLDELEKALKPLGREPHSVIGSSCLGASALGGVCNNSGGSLIHRGPAYTELALFAQVDGDGRLHLINQLGIDLGRTPEEILKRLDNGRFSDADIETTDRLASDPDYARYVRDIDADTPARFNGDSRRLYGASGSAGKVIVFAVRLDTFKAELNTKTFYIGSNSAGDLTKIRRTMLATFASLPIAAEYVHRDAFDIAERYGKDTFLLIKHLGTARLPRLFAIKSRIDAFAGSLPFFPRDLTDRTLQFISRFFPPHLPARLKEFRDKYEHHLLLKVSNDGVGETSAFLKTLFSTGAGDFFECTNGEGVAAFLHRFAVAGAAVRYRAVHRAKVGEIVALDIALPRNTIEWQERLPESLGSVVLKRLYYGHFFCQVFHQDYIISKGAHWSAVEHSILETVQKRGGKYPAEHNFGHLYPAGEAVAEHYRKLDPCNCFNPGIGQTSKRLRWRGA